MNIHETAAVLAYLGSAWPSWDMSDDNADVWGNELAEWHVDVAREAARNLVRTSKFPPSIAEFLEECRQVRVRQHAAATQRREIEASSSPADFPAEEFAALRKRLTDWSAKGHNHKGPEPCPLCASARDGAA